MENSIEDNSIVSIGNTEYIYHKEGNQEFLTREEELDNRKINIVIKSVDSQNSKETEKYITDLLGSLYIERILKNIS